MSTEEKKVGTEQLKSSKAFIDYSQIIDDTCEYLEDYNPTMKGEKLILFHDMIPNVDINIDVNIDSLFTELFMRARKLNTSLIFISQSSFRVPKYLRCKGTNYVIKKTPTK